MFEVADLHVFHGRTEAVRAVDLVIAEGSIVTVIGPNGAGKSTLLLGLMGLLRTTGSIRFGGAAMDGMTVEDRVGLGIALVPEQRALFGTMTVRENLELGSLAGAPKTPHDRRDSLAMVFDLFPRLEERQRQVANTLSGGERQMLALGRALMGKPRLLLLDEPSLGLAPLIVLGIFDVIAKLRTMKVSMLLVEQNARAALDVADYGYVLETGAVTMSGTARNLAQDARVVDAYLGQP